MTFPLKENRKTLRENRILLHSHCCESPSKQQRTKAPTSAKKLHMLFISAAKPQHNPLPTTTLKPPIQIRITPVPASSVPLASSSNSVTTFSETRVKASSTFDSQNLMSVFKRWYTALPNRPFTYHANSHDYGIEINSLLLDNSSVKDVDGAVDPSTMRIFDDMKKIGAKQGFEITSTGIPNFPRDGWVLTPHYGMALPSNDPCLEQAMQVNNSQLFCNSKSAVHSSSHSSFHKFLGTVFDNNSEYEHYLKISGRPITRLKYYIEGGNYYHCTNASGEKRLLIGKDHLNITHNQFKLNGTFQRYPKALKKFSATIRMNISDKTLRKTFQEMYMQGYIQHPDPEKKGSISEAEKKEVASQLTSELQKGFTYGQKAFLNKAIELGFYTEYQPTVAELQNAKESIIAYLAEKELTIHLMGAPFNIQRNEIFFIDQCNSLIDMFMRPGPKGSIFLQNYEMTEQVLEALSTSTTLTQNDRLLLERYQITAAELHCEIGPLLAKAKKTLESAGFFVIDTPAIIMDRCKTKQINEGLANNQSQTFNVNFMNAVTGYSPKTCKHYYITLGAHTKDNLGQHLMEAFAAFLKTYDPNIDVHFVGENPERPGDFSHAGPWSNNDSKDIAGIHSLTLECNTTTHTG